MADTIFALATAPGQAGIAVIRVSGPQAWDGAKSLTGRRDFRPREAINVTLRQPGDDGVLDRALLLPFRAPASYTGEDSIEYHLHGGRAVIESVLRALAALPGHRMAEPGEFTRRAVENGKMDLTAAEAVADLIAAETEAQRMQALEQMNGALADLYQGWAGRLTDALAHAEADIEFPDEDMPEDVAPAVMDTARDIAAQIATHLDDNRRGERLREGWQVAVIGAPNAGKSSLVNALAQREIAIVSAMAGTTRDVIEAHLDIGGYPVILADTAGLRPGRIGESGHDAIESEGIQRALQRARDADIRILVFDGSAGDADAATLALHDARSLVVWNKADLGGVTPALPGALYVSAKTGTGMYDLVRALNDTIRTLAGRRDTPSLTRARHRAALEEAHRALQRAQGVQGAVLPELAAEDLRLAVRALGRITGRVDIEDILDAIFRDFCIGK